MKPFRMLLVVSLSSALGFWGCGGSGGEDGGTDSDLDTGTDSDGDTDSDTDSDTGTDSGNDCTGGGVWYDETSGLCWENPQFDGVMCWYMASGTYHYWQNPDSVDYCGDLVISDYSDWRLPNIDELISLIRGCVDGTETEDLSLSTCEMKPEGCVETPPCTGASSCSMCDDLFGPGENGYYLDPALSGGDVCNWWWSSSPYNYNLMFSINFAGGYVGFDDVNGVYSLAGVRCVRSVL